MLRQTVIVALATLVLAGVVAPARGATSDPYFSKQWGLHKIRAEEAWALGNGSGSLIAVVDTGVDLTHPDLATKLIVLPDADFVEPKGTCKRNGQCVQDGAQDKNGHGTHVAGIAAAITNNGIGVAGVAPRARILPVRVLDADGEGGTVSGIASGIRYAADKGARVVNLSLTFWPPGVDKLDRALGNLGPVYDAIDYAYAKGAVIVVAAGNDSFPLCAEPSAHPRVLCVGATDRNDLRTFYSNSDATLSSQYLVAPGGESLSCAGDIFSTYLRGVTSDCAEDGYEALSGTSMAAPFVSGVAAMLAAKGLTNDRIVTCIVSNTDDLGPPGRDLLFGYGRLNALKAVSAC
ncbi:MAG: S8 family peptidase [Actinomycetota bacterium]